MDLEQQSRLFRYSCEFCTESLDFCQLQLLAPSNVYMLKLSGPDKQHKFTPESIKAIHRALDIVESSPNATALLTTSEGKFYSNGVDVKFGGNDVQKRKLFMQQFQDLLKRVLCFPLPTVTAICGHAVGGGCFFALAHDYRIMRADKGLMFINEVDIGLVLTPGITALIKSKLPKATYQQAILTGQRYNGTNAQTAGLVHEAYLDETRTLEAALGKATQYASRKWTREVYRGLKKEMFKSEAKELECGGFGFARL